MEMVSYGGCLLKIKENKEIRVKKNIKIISIYLISSIMLRKSSLKENDFLIKKRVLAK